MRVNIVFKIFSTFFRVFSAIHPLRAEFGKQDDSRIFSPATVIFIPFAPVRRIIYRRVFCKFPEKGGTMRNPFIISAFFRRLPEKSKKRSTLKREYFLFCPSRLFSIGATGFEPTTSATRTLRPTKLGHAPTDV